MFGSDILDLALGLIVVYLLMAVICSSVREAIEHWMKTRSSYLEFGMREMLHDRDGTGLTAQLYSHPLIYSLFHGDYVPPSPTKIARGRPPMRAPKGSRLPTYIPAETFALALMDIAARGPRTDATTTDGTAERMSPESIRANIANLDNEPVQRIVLTALDSAGDNLAAVRIGLENWYNGAMDRVSSWYTRSTKGIIFVIALVATVGMNVNTITVADYLVRNDTTRAMLATYAARNATETAPNTMGYEQAQAELRAMALPIGWSGGWGAPLRGDEPGSDGIWNDIAAPVLGWLITAMAATMGAPFWFNMLNKVSVFKATMKARERMRDDLAEDRSVTPMPVPAAVVAPAFGTAGLGVSYAGLPVSGPALPPIIGPGGEIAAGAWPPSGATAHISTPADEDTGVDCCTSREHDAATADEELPQAEGGVAS